ncbi:DinB family protein [Brevibacillus sp. SYSU BS000544]|uniref:DinB family protein n=1 Tax=Brevibacillus sp. SYSU BS000544 TaxID=3416443 RepID=UPI003CE47A36
MVDGKKDVLLDQLAACQNDPSWFPTIEEALAGLTAEQAAWSENEATSIWQIVHHLTFWNYRWLRRFKEGKDAFDKVDNEMTFSVSGTEITEDEWQLTVDKLNRSFADWRETLAACDESKLDEPIPTFAPEARWWGAISNLCTHNAYHIGQIVLMKKRLPM